MIFVLLRLVFLLLLTGAVTLLAQDKITLNYADSLVGKIIDNEQVREATGNVSLTHNNTKITCNRVVQYFDQNKAELYGNVRVVKDTLTITAPSGTYYGNERKIVCPNGATLTDPKATLKANYGTYYFDQDLANFRGNVRIYDSRSYTITSDALQYYRQQDKSFASGNVKIVTDSSIVYSDSLIYERPQGISNAFGNVKIESDSTIITSNKAVHYDYEKKSICDGNVKINFTNKNSVIYGSYGENYEKTNYSFVQGKARLIKIETDKDKNTTDTVFIFSEKMESFRNKPEYYIGTDSVKVIRQDFLSSSQKGYYFKNEVGEGGVVALSKDPAVWKENLQVTGDSIYANFKKDLDDIYVKKSAFALQTNLTYTDRFDQISGVFMYMKFIDNEIDYIQVDTNAASIYYTYDNFSANGVNKADGDIIILFFKDKIVEKVKVVGLPKGTYYPEGLLNTENMRLLGFRVRNDKPNRDRINN